MAFEFSKPKEGMMPGTEPEAIWPTKSFLGGSLGIETIVGRHQQGADGKPYIVYTVCCCFRTYTELSDALKPTDSFGRFVQYGQLRHPGFLYEVKEAQKKIRQLAQENGIDIPYECLEYGSQGNGLSINRT